VNTTKASSTTVPSRPNRPLRSIGALRCCRRERDGVSQPPTPVGNATAGDREDDTTRTGPSRPSAVCRRLRGGLDSGMEETNRPRYAFKIGQQVYRHTGGPLSRGGKRTGPYMIVGMVRQPDGAPSLYRISGPNGEQLVDGGELKLALGRKE